MGAIVHWDKIGLKAREDRETAIMTATRQPQIGWPDTCMQCGRARGSPAAALGPLGRRRADNIRLKLLETVQGTHPLGTRDMNTWYSRVFARDLGVRWRIERAPNQALHVPTPALVRPLSKGMLDDKAQRDAEFGAESEQGELEDELGFM